MNEKLFWSGLILQGVNLLFLLIIFAPSIKFPQISQEILLGIGYIIFNLITLGMIIVGALKEDKDG